MEWLASTCEWRTIPAIPSNECVFLSEHGRSEERMQG
jgi:hypothetical protein